MVRKKVGLTLVSEKPERVYCIAANDCPVKRKARLITMQEHGATGAFMFCLPGPGWTMLH